nr:hypothetical protein BaRGS_016816 [Batillaria attramentaria]
MFCRAANIFAAFTHSRGHDDMPGLHRRKTLANLDTRPKIQIPEMDFKDPAEKKTVYELAFATLKWNQYVFDDILDDTNFFNYHSELREDGPLVMVILWDYQSRKFQPRVAIGDEVLHETCLEIEQAILDMKTKLNASLARRRIKAANDLLEQLKDDGFQQTWKIPTDSATFTDKTFFVDPHCSDMLVFSMDCAPLLQEHPLVVSDLQILKDLSASEEENSGQLNGLMAKHINVLRHALRLNKLQGAVYLTRSVNMEENEVAVERALEYVNMLQVQVKKMLPWRVIPPVLPFSGDDVEYERGIVGKYVKFQPTSMMNGCFLVAIAREPDEPKPITGRSRSRGLTGKGSKSRANGSLTSGESTPGSSQESPQTPDVGEGKHKRKGSSTKKAKKPFQPVTTARAALLKKKLSMAEKAAARLAQPQHPVAKKDSNPEHIRVVKHPAPFR